MPGAAITETAPVHQILDHIGEPHQPPPIHPPRGPPDWIDAQERVFLDEDLKQDRSRLTNLQDRRFAQPKAAHPGGAQGRAP
jgi:hypothetical protein